MSVTTKRVNRAVRFISALAVLCVSSLCYLLWANVSGDDADVRTPDASELNHVPVGYHVHTDTTLQQARSDPNEPATYAVVDIPVPQEQAVEQLLRAYEDRGWERRDHFLVDDGCIIFENKQSFVADTAGGPRADAYQERTDWAERSISDPTRQLVMSLVAC